MFDYIPLMLAQPGPTADAPPASKDAAAAPAKDGSTAAPTPGTPGTPATPGTPSTGTPGAPLPQQRPPSMFGDASFLFILMGGLALMIFFSWRTQSRERKKREALLGSLKKGDRIQTIGGLLGTVLEVREDRVVIKADENNNTKLTFVRAAVQAVVSDRAADKPEPDVKRD